MAVVISPNVQKESVRINVNGDEIDPKSKQVIKKNEPEFKPTREQIEAQINAPKQTQEDHVSSPAPLVQSTLSITQQIQEAEQHLVELKMQKKMEIERKRKELAELESE